MNCHKKTFLLILVATLVRGIVAVTTELGNDEVYYRMYAQYLQWNYFDHPPMVGWLIRCTTLNLYFDNAFFIRLGPIICSAGTTWVLFLSGKKLSNEYCGFLAAAIYTATVYGSVIAGTFILPDSPQMFFWAIGLYLLIDISENNRITFKKKKNILFFGIVCGLGMLCKIHTSFLWLGFLLYIIIYNRNWLLQPILYIAGVVTLLFFFPVIQWNIENHFVTYLYHSKRVNVSDAGINFNSFAIFSLGQILYLNPIVYFLLLKTTVASLKNKLAITSSQNKLLLWTSLPLIIIATCISFFKEVLPHWPSPAYTGLILLAAVYLSRKNYSIKNILPKPILFANMLLLFIIAAGILIINYLPGTLGKKQMNQLGDGDFTLDMYGWQMILPEVKKIIESDAKNNLMSKDAPFIINNWFPAAHTDFYIAMPLQKVVIAIGDTNNIHQYAWINKERIKLKPGHDAYCLVPSNYYIEATSLYKKHFDTILPPIIILQQRSNKPCRQFYIYRLKGYRKQ